MRVLVVQERNTNNVTEKKVNNKKGAKWLLFLSYLNFFPLGKKFV
jgi:hypothetical protein